MSEPEIVEDFYGVYLLYNINPKFKGRTYIGYTRDPNRRITQHNRGKWAGGAHRTSNRGPWKMVMIVHGFPNNISALRFEWAWQNPNKTTRLQHLDLKKIPRKESEFQFKLRVLSEMLRVGPWYRLPLVIRWLESEYQQDFPIERKPPNHMPICSGLVKSYNPKKVTDNISKTIECLLCSDYLKDNEQLKCTNINCDLVAHIICLGNLFLTPGEFVPIDGYCPFCNTYLKWGELIRRRNGYGQGVIRDAATNDDNDADDEPVCTQDRVFIDNLDDYDDDVVFTQEIVANDDVVLTQETRANGVEVKDDDDDDVPVLDRNKVYDDQPSWFLDCREDL